jgi:5-enolpyruvylshikimate-3-phosphate synthase
MPTDHGYSDHRIALAIAVLTWLASLPGAPPAD